MMLFGGYAVEISMEIIIDFHNEILHRRQIMVAYVEPDGVSTSVAVVVTNSDFDIATVVYICYNSIAIFMLKKG